MSRTVGKKVDEGVGETAGKAVDPEGSRRQHKAKPRIDLSIFRLPN